MKALPQICVRICPFVALSYSIVVIVLTTYINEKITPLFIFFCVQVYLNWYSVYAISHNAATVEIRPTGKKVFVCNKVASSNTDYKYWYCEKCNDYTCKPTQHCIFCKKCYHFRDHHCFFLGTCILRQNIGNFILFCFYTSLTCIYSLCTLGPYLYENINRVMKADTDTFNIFLNFCFPIALVRMLHSRENTYILLVTMFDVLVSILCICLVYATWKLHSCMTGKQRYANISGKQNLKEIFGSYGLSNIFFPYNGLIGTRDLHGKYELKQV
ncbi:Palmitoyltransferase ZDHHC22 [Anthophora plagiata]